MINILPGTAALLFAVLLELFAGNWYVPLSEGVSPFHCGWEDICGYIELDFMFIWVLD